MTGVHAITLVTIGVVWLVAWRDGLNWCVRCGVTERASAWALACTLPTAGLIASVQFVALLSMASGRGLLTPEAVAVVFIMLVCLARRLILRLPACAGERPGPALKPASGLRGAWRVPMLIVVGMYGAFLLDAVTRYPTGWDGLHYHLLVAVGWARDHAINLTKGVIHQCFPENGMIVACLLAFGKLERLFPLVHLPKALLLGAVMFGLARAVGAGRRASISCVCVGLSVPLVVFQSVSSYIDLYAATAWLSALLALVWATRARTDVQRRGLVTLAGLAAGIALGSKTTYLVLVPLLGVVAVAGEWLRPGGLRFSMRRAAGCALLFGLGVFACSAFWFVRGAVRAGNPFYPLAVEVAGHQLLPGYTAQEAFPERSLRLRVKRWWDYPWRESKNSSRRGYPYSTGNALGAAYATFVPVGVLAALISTLRRRGRARMQGHHLEERWQLIYVILALSGIVMLLTIFHEMLRFILPLVLVAVPVAALLIDRLTAYASRMTLTLLTLSLGTTATIATIQPVHSILGRVRSGNWSRAAFYEIPELIDTFEPGTRLLNLASPTLSYPLLGDNLSNVVITPEHWGKLLNGRTISATALREHGIDYIYTRPPWPRDWPTDLPLELVYDDTHAPRLATTAPTRVYRVVASEQAAGRRGTYHDFTSGVVYR
ncbi:MAG: hypothetical protein ACE5HE_00800 [Phycisphaerae bacterium]